MTAKNAIAENHSRNGKIKKPAPAGPPTNLKYDDETIRRVTRLIIQMHRDTLEELARH